MHTRAVSSRAVCAYCGAGARPNAMYCMSCGQIVTVPQQQAAAHSSAQLFPPQQPAAAAPNPPLQQYVPQQYLPPMPSAAAAAPSPGAAAEAPTSVPPPLPRLSGRSDADAQVVELALLSGQRARIHGTTVLGRMPEATARNSGAQAIAIPDETKSISRAHAIIERHGQAVTISDAGSANGSVIERDGAVIDLPEGREVSLRDGDRVWLGDVPLDVHIGRAVRETSR